MKFYLACTVLTKRKWERSQAYKHKSIFLKRNTIAYQKSKDHDSGRKTTMLKIKCQKYYKPPVGRAVVPTDHPSLVGAHDPSLRTV
jgi:hypothetical protein